MMERGVTGSLKGVALAHQVRIGAMGILGVGFPWVNPNPPQVRVRRRVRVRVNPSLYMRERGYIAARTG